MKIQFKGVVCAVTQPTQVQGKNGAITKCQMFVAPTMFDPNTGEPAYGDFSNALNIDVMDKHINDLAALRINERVTITADLRGRSSQQQDGTIKGFLSLSLLRVQSDEPQQQAAPQAQQQQPMGGGGQFGGGFSGFGQ